MKIIFNKGTLLSSDISEIYRKIAGFDLSYSIIVITPDNVLEIYTPSRIMFKLKRAFNKNIEHIKLGLYTIYDIDVDNLNKYIIEI